MKRGILTAAEQQKGHAGLRAVSALSSAPRTPHSFRPASRAACAAMGTRLVHAAPSWAAGSGSLQQIHSLPVSSEAGLHPARPAASPSAPAGGQHASVEADPSGEITS